MNAEELQDWAEKCRAASEATNDQEERTRLMKMYEAIIELVRTEEWLGGKSVAA
jgi:hypothetical protein